jgi:signal transduction histidine kinase
MILPKSWRLWFYRLPARIRAWRSQPEQTQTKSAAYQAWRQHFLLSRLKIALWVATPVSILLAANGLSTYLYPSPQLKQDIISLFGDSSLLSQLQMQTMINTGVLFTVLLSCWGLRWSRWGRQHPRVIFLLLCSILTWSDMVVGSFVGIPVQPDARFFLVQTVLVPIHWRLHLATQLIPLAHYVLIYPLTGLTQVGNRPFFNPQSIQTLIDLCWISLLCTVSVYLYEKLKRSEFESQHQLRSVIYALSHDLKTPIIGASVALQGLLQKPGSELAIHRDILEQLLAGNQRQLSLINALQSAKAAETGQLNLDLQSFSLAQLVAEVVADLGAIAEAHHMDLHDCMSANLPLVNADKTQIWRTLNNLIANALKHNPRGTQIKITAEVVDRGHAWRGHSPIQLQIPPHSLFVRCTVADNGVGIPPAQLPHLFDLYTRGQQSRRMPGLGLGLYLCQQIVTAHQGEIGVSSQPNQGSQFWFTLPIAEPVSPTINR